MSLRGWFDRQPEARRPLLVLIATLAAWVVLGIPVALLMAALGIAFGFRLW